MTTTIYNTPSNKIIQADCMAVLTQLEASSVDLIYIDPPFCRRENQTLGLRGSAYDDQFEDYIEFLKPILEEAHRVLATHGSMYLHTDDRLVYCVLDLMDMIFGEDCFWSADIGVFDVGGKSISRRPDRIDNILCYVKDPDNYAFILEYAERYPFLTSGFVTAENAVKEKCLADTGYRTFVPENGKQGTAYPTQMPIGILEQIISESSNPGDLVLDFFAGSGITGEVALQLGRRFLLVDHNPNAIAVMAERFSQYPGIEYIGFTPDACGGTFQPPRL